jgi:hypothetical protein
MRTPVKYRMLRETIYFYVDQIIRLETLSHQTGLKKSELVRIALESFLRFNGLQNPEFRFLPDDVEEEKVAQYREEFMEPFVRMMREDVDGSMGGNNENE